MVQAGFILEGQEKVQYGWTKINKEQEEKEGERRRKKVEGREARAASWVWWTRVLAWLGQRIQCYFQCNYYSTPVSSQTHYCLEDKLCGSFSHFAYILAHDTSLDFSSPVPSICVAGCMFVCLATVVYPHPQKWAPWEKETLSCSLQIPSALHSGRHKRMLRVFFHLCLFFVVVVGRLGGLFVCFEGFIVLFCFVFGAGDLTQVLLHAKYT